MSDFVTDLHNALPTMGKKHNRYCGPAALAAITGLTTGDAAAALRKSGACRAIRGASTEQMLRALSEHGYSVNGWVAFYPRMNMLLRKWLDTYYTGQLALVNAMNHWWAIDGECYVDSFNRLPTSTDNIHNPRSQVSDIWYLEY